MTHDGENRRAEVRHAVRFAADLAVEGSFLIASVRDISSLGLFVATQSPAVLREIGEALEIQFDVPEELRAIHELPERLSLAAEVMWRTKGPPNSPHPGMGLRFVELDDFQRDALVQIVKAVAYLGDDDAT